MLFHKSNASFESMVQAHAADLYRFAYWLCRDRSRAEDLVQETFARAWAHWTDVRDEKAAKGWLLTILHNEHARAYEKKRVAIDPDQALDDLIMPAADDVYQQMEMRDALWKLPEAYREPLLLQVLGGFSCAEIGDMLGLAEGAVMQRLTRARQAMRRLMEPQQQKRERRS